VTFQALDEIRGDRGGRAIFNRFRVRELAWDKTALVDVDTLDDLRQLMS
jgi:CTP:molybdopterin cytidylyltransferase MocA